ncbi:MAG: SGNH/GDSL hydrolase family protein [Syntrophales bacterium]
MNIKSLALFLLVSIFTLTAVELLLRYGSPCYFADDYAAYRHSPELGYELKNSLSLRRSTDYEREIYTNKMGTVNFQEDFSNYQTLIFACGDSFTQGVGVPEDTSYPFQLDLLLNLKGDTYYPKYGVVNLGVAGYGTEQALRQIKRYRKKIGPPHYILFLGNETDYLDDLAFRAGGLHRGLLEGNPNYSPLVIGPLQWLQYETEIGKRVTRLLKGRISQDELLRIRGLNFVELQGPVLQELIDLSKELNATLIISWVPCYWSKEISPNYLALKQYAARNNLAFADWYPMVKAVLDKNPNVPAVNYHSAGHYRTWINQMIARAFAQQIKCPPGFAAR